MIGELTLARRGRVETEVALWWSLMELGDSSTGFRTASSGNNDSEEVLVLRVTRCTTVRPAMAESNTWFNGQERGSTADKRCGEYSNESRSSVQGFVEPLADRCVINPD